MSLITVSAFTWGTKKVNQSEGFKRGVIVDDKQEIRSHCDHNIRPSKELFFNLQWHLLFD